MNPEDNILRILGFVDGASLYNLANKTNLVHSFSCMFISILYMFWATMCPSSGEITVSMRHLVFVTLKQVNIKLLTFFRVTNPRCRIDIVISPNDGHIVARKVWRIKINIQEKFCSRSVLFARQYSASCKSQASPFCLQDNIPPLANPRHHNFVYKTICLLQIPGITICL
jgi:hypothetical protein